MIDIVVIGAGHAGVEAAIASSKMGHRTLLCTLDLNKVALMPCNPSVGGPAKGIVTREIEALGGVMGKVADETALQFKMLNMSKGPGVRSLRVQSDKDAYSQRMKEILLEQENLEIKIGMVMSINFKEDTITSITMNDGEEIFAKAFILTSGTYMNSLVMISDQTEKIGPEKQPTSSGLSDSLKAMGIELIRLKTGTPARIKTSSVDFSKTIEQPGDTNPVLFSRFTDRQKLIDKQISCFLTYTNANTHEIIEENIHLSSMYSGVVSGVGARYCPSIEDKLVRFADKERHQLFIEPETKRYDQIYLQGLSSSLPAEVQDRMIKTIAGLEQAEVLQYGYAIEYDALNPFQLTPTLRVRNFKNFYTAGQINGTSGYEEAAGQGIMAGINASLMIQGKDPFILRRDEAYIGVMIDDLVTKGTDEPYRLLTSRAEYRLLLRHDNAYRRLTAYAKEFGLRSTEEIESIETMLQEVDDLIAWSQETSLESWEQLGLPQKMLVIDAIKRPQFSLQQILESLNLEVDEEIVTQAEIEIKYAGYIAKALKDANKLKTMDTLVIPKAFDYEKVDHLAIEAKQKLLMVKPHTLGQASRISGVNPADITVLAMALGRLHD